MRYQIPRTSEETARYVERDGDSVYLFMRFEDRVDVYKFTQQQLLDAENAAQLISVTTPMYRLSGGECTCDGYLYRQRCRHTKRLAYLNGTNLTGWRGAGK